VPVCDPVHFALLGPHFHIITHWTAKLVTEEVKVKQVDLSH